MTQQDIVDAVNRLTVGYNVTWNDIKKDADKAIYKINSYLGASYPLMSSILNSPYTQYAIQAHGKLIPIFSDQYIMSIVVPYIASEILSRDEEFTTIYNKYLLDVEDGLFTMFSNEFNRVPPMFRQPETTGVFFANDVPQKHLEHDIVKHLPKITFRINYHLNNNYVLTDDQYVDTIEYEYNGEYRTPDVPSSYYYSSNGLRKYRITGWYYDEACTQEVPQTGNIYSDLNIYAKWEYEDVIELYDITIDGIRYVSPRVKVNNVNVPKLDIPEYFNGKFISAIGSDFISLYNSNDNFKLNEITLPRSIKHVCANAFQAFRGTKINFPTDPTANITIADNALNLSNSKIALIEPDTYGKCSLVLPKSIKVISDNAFYPTVSTTPTREIYVYCETPYLAKPETFTLTRNGYIVSGTIGYRIFYNGD